MHRSKKHLHSSPRRQSQAAKGGRTEYAPVAVPQRECRDFSLPTGLTPAQQALCPNLNFGFAPILILVGDRIHLCAVRNSKVPLGNCAAGPSSIRLSNEIAGGNSFPTAQRARKSPSCAVARER